jgi:drug/metabolite transporter (DMT)-like permease
MARVAVALLTVYVIWGSTYLGIRVVVTNGLPALTSMGVRFLVSGSILLAVLALLHGRASLRVDRAQLGGSAVVGLLLLLGGNGLVSIAEKTVPSGLTALLVATTPLWMVVLGALVFRQRTRTATWVGTLVGFAGTAVLARPGGHGEAVQWWGVGLILCATSAWATGSLLSSRLRMPQDLFVGAAYQMVTAGAAMTVVGGAAGEWRGLDLAAVPARGWVALVYLTTFGSLVAYTAYYWLLRNAPLQLASTYAYVNPVVAVILGWALLAEEVTAAVVVGGGIALVGVAVVIRSERRGTEDSGGDVG